MWVLYYFFTWGHITAVYLNLLNPLSANDCHACSYETSSSCLYPGLGSLHWPNCSVSYASPSTFNRLWCRCSTTVHQPTVSSTHQFFRSSPGPPMYVSASSARRLFSAISCLWNAGIPPSLGGLVARTSHLQCSIHLSIKPLSLWLTYYFPPPPHFHP